MRSAEDARQRLQRTAFVGVGTAGGPLASHCTVPACVPVGCFASPHPPTNFPHSNPPPLFDTDGGAPNQIDHDGVANAEIISLQTRGGVVWTAALITTTAQVRFNTVPTMQRLYACSLTTLPSPSSLLDHRFQRKRTKPCWSVTTPKSTSNVATTRTV